jgi:hypothetical protein
MSCMGVLKAYLPMVYDSSMAVEGAKKSNMPFNEADLAGIVLNLVPVTWVNQYNVTHSTLPKSPRALLPDLEVIEYVINKKHQESLKAKAEEASTASMSAKGSSKKHSTCKVLPALQEQGRPPSDSQHQRVLQVQQGRQSHSRGCR